MVTEPLPIFVGMNRLLPLIASILIISCTTEQREQKKIYHRLQAWDTFIYANPQAIKDSLSQISKDKLSDKTLAYYYLLWNIMKDKCGEYMDVDSDTTILQSLRWYRQSDDKHNLCRALLYSAKNISEQANHNDTTGLAYLREAEDILDKNNINDIETKAEIFRYIGIALSYKYYVITYSPQSADGLPEQYLNRSINLYTKIRKYRETDLLYIDMIELFLKNNKHIDKAFYYLEKMSDKKALSPEIRYLLYNHYCKYYSFIQDPRMVIYYAHKIISENISKLPYSHGISAQYYTIAQAYRQLNLIDSTITFCDLAINSSFSETYTNPKAYFILKAECLKELKDYKAAYEAYSNYNNSNSLFLISKASNTIQKIKNIARQDKIEVTKAKQDKERVLVIFLTTTIVFSISTIVLLIVFLHRKNKCKIINAETDKNIRLLKEENNKQWIINEILKISSGSTLQMLDNVGIEAARLRKTSKESYESLNEILNKTRATTKNDITNIIKDEYITTLFPELSSLPDLSPYEKIILILVNQGCSNKDISDILASNQSSVRTIKSKIKDKINNASGLQYDPLIAFPYLYKEPNQNF